METCRCVAVLSDVHGNAVALAALLDELDVVSPDLVVFGGDLDLGAVAAGDATRPELRTRTVFAQAVDRYRATGDPLAEEMVELLETPRRLRRSSRMEATGVRRLTPLSTS